MIETEPSQKTIRDIIKDAGGPAAVVAACDGSVSVDAVYKWYTIGIPDRHWVYIMPLAGTTAAEMLTANLIARQGTESQAGAAQ